MAFHVLRTEENRRGYRLRNARGNAEDRHVRVLI